MSDRIRIVVAAHKPYAMPGDPMYLPLHVGAAGKERFGFATDDTGENISEKNPYFCELTGLYWAWKNLDADYIGLAHYRRHFGGANGVLTRKEIEPDLGTVRVFVPKKRRYYIESLQSHYAHTHYASHLEQTKEVLSLQCPEYLDAYARVMKRTWGYMFNMSIMEKELLDSYCSWIFGILETLFERIDTTDYTAFEKRYPGRISELLFNVWLAYMISHGKLRRAELKELPLFCAEKENWWVKGKAFLKAKFFKKGYDKSF